jgi:hypothetical protein
MEKQTQPEALRLAEKIDLEWRNDALNYDTALDAAAELRRLHKENERLKLELEEVNWILDDLSH